VRQAIQTTKMRKHNPSNRIEDDFRAYPHESNPDPEAFAELIFTKLSRTSHLFSTSGPDSGPLLAVTTSSIFARGKPSAMLHSTATEDSPALGVVRLGFWRKHNIGFCANANEENVGASEEGMEWLKLVRVSILNFKKFEFEYEGKSYLWTTLRAAYYGDRPDIELREKVADGAGETVLAFYKGERKKERMKMGRGVFFLRGKRWSEARELELGRWELVVLLTGLGIVEATAREAARRRSAG
jgi:hypothetical protein